MSSQPVRVLVNTSQPYGAQRVARTLAEAFGSLGHSPEIVLWDEPRQAAPAAWAGVPVRRLERGRGGSVGFARQVRALAGVLGDDPGPILAVLTYSNLLALTAAMLSRTEERIVVSEHNFTSLALANSDARARTKITLMRNLYPRAAGIVGVSRDVSEDLVRLLALPNGSVTTILNPVDVRQVRAESAGDAPHKWLHEPSRPTLVCPGGLRTAKGQARLLRALTWLDDVHAVFVGDGPDLRTLRRCAVELGVEQRVDFVGWQDNPYPWMRAADAVAIPSRWEGFGLVAVEAAALGVPVVGSDCAGLGEVLRLIGARTVAQLGPHEDVEFARKLAGQLSAALSEPAPAYRLGAFQPRAAAIRYATLMGLQGR